MSFTEIISSALIMGAISSFHCIGMCGPLALSLPLPHNSDKQRLLSGLVYNMGRISTYSVLGLLLGFAGQYLIAAKYQSTLSIILGILILAYLLIPKKQTALKFNSSLRRPFIALRSALSNLFRNRSYSSVFSIGILNGLLPCGMIYLALTYSFITGSAWKGSLFMLCFGLGTFPIMFSVSFLGGYFGQQLRLKIRKAVPVCLFIMAVLLVMRGLNLGIPYLSPYVSQHGAASVSCH